MRQFVLGMYGRKERFYNYGKYVDVFVMLCGGDDLKGRFSVGQYRAIDLTLFAFMLIIFETIAVSAATRWFPAEPYTVSVVAAVTAIVMMRWGIWGAIHAVLGGIVFCRASGGTAEQYAIYCIGNLLALGTLGLKKAWGTETIRQDALKTMLFGGLTLVLIHIFGIHFTGTSVNPARSFGPAFFAKGQAMADLWVFIAAPLAGAVVAAIIWKMIEPCTEPAEEE